MLKILDKIYVKINKWVSYGSIWSPKNLKRKSFSYKIRNFVGNIYKIPYNIILCKKFPWLVPSNRFSGHKITDKSKGYWPDTPNEIPKYNWDYTELDAMPDGWRLAFGINMCKEIQAALSNYERIDDFRIFQIKEKYGTLCFYCANYTEEVSKIIRNYEILSEHICINCGKKAELYSTWWISPYCKKCASTVHNEKFVPYAEYWKTETNLYEMECEENGV